MTGTRPAEILRRLDVPRADDRALAVSYAFHNDEAAFAELVRRHGPVVWAACLRVAGNCHDAEDAFQAAFLVFMRRLPTIRNFDLLGNWLYGVAVRVALKARRSAARRRARERQVPTMPDPADHRALTQPGSPDACDLGPVIDEELAALPAWYREAVVLCDLRGVSREDAAKLLGIPEGTLSSRLAAGRKKLAARLARRGVTLSAAAIPGVLGAGARAAVPAELAAKAVHICTGVSAAPVAVARLASEGFSVKTLLMGVLFAGAAAGVVYAAGPTDPPQQSDPPKPPAAVAKTIPAAEAKPAEKVTFTTRPRMQIARDYAIGTVHSVHWSPDGQILAIHGSTKAMFGQDNFVQLDPALFAPTAERPQLALEASSGLVGFTPDGKNIVTQRRERGLVSGFHRIEFLKIAKGKDGLTIEPKPPVDLDADDTHGYAFASDGKTYRTVSYILGDFHGGVRRYRDVAVREVDSMTGKTLKTLMTAKGDVLRYSLSPNGERVCLVDSDGILAVHEVGTGKRLWEKEMEKPLRNQQGQRFSSVYWVEFSLDGSRLAVSNEVGGGQDAVRVFDATTGKPLAELEAAAALRSPGRPSFTGDGRLLALSLNQGTSGPTEYLSVWDTDSGKLLKRWDRRAVVAFHPTKPVLAILEANGQNTTRLGLWDFAAEPGKK